MTARAVYFDSPISFAEGVRIQEQLVRARAAGAIPDTVLFLEHRPVVTLGSRGRDQALLKSTKQLEAMGIEFARASRGGDVTYHGPGQLILYPILKLGEKEADAHGYLWNLEEIAIRTAADFGVEARRRKGMNGAWTDAGKIAAIGFRLKRWVTMHGMSFNVDVDLAGFETIIPCGLKGEPVSSLKAILGARCPTLIAVRDRMRAHFETVCGRPLELVAADLAALP
ncbi:MAG: lipoyl(octanoyl) transferase [Verrucomicrobia bacterium A1]|nr:MAG: lipoyl(octanoyl) transferase [Verrucomicrobia bacterium A1]